MGDKVDKLKGWFAEQNDYGVTISRVYHTAPSRLRNPILIPSLTSTVHHLPSPSFVEGLTLPPSSTNWRLSKWRIGWKLPLPYKFIVWSKSDLLNPVSDTTKLESNAASSSLFSIRDFAPGLDSGGATNLMAATKSCHVSILPTGSNHSALYLYSDLWWFIVCVLSWKLVRTQLALFHW